MICAAPAATAMLPPLPRLPLLLPTELLAVGEGGEGEGGAAAAAELVAAAPPPPLPVGCAAELGVGALRAVLEGPAPLG
jgi:hypothetical protein